MTITLKELTAAKKRMAQHRDDFTVQEYNTLLSLLDSHINPPDLDATIAQCVEHAKRNWREGAWGYIEGEIVVDTVRLLSSRIVREGCVVVPVEPTEEMKEAGAKERLRQDRNDELNTNLVYKAMIAAAKGD